MLVPTFAALLAAGVKVRPLQPSTAVFWRRHETGNRLLSHARAVDRVRPFGVRSDRIFRPEQGSVSQVRLQGPQDRPFRYLLLSRGRARIADGGAAGRALVR